jgi:hypothetical protein
MMFTGSSLTLRTPRQIWIDFAYQQEMAMKNLLGIIVTAASMCAA